MKRVLQLTGSFNQGGSERQAVQLTRLLHADEEFDVRIAVLSDEGPLRAEITALGIANIPAFPLTSFYDANFLRQIRRGARYLRDNKIDVVHTHDFYTNVFGMLAARLAGVKARVASKRETTGMRSTAQKAVERNAYRLARRIVVNAGAVRDYLAAQGIAPAKIEVVYNGLDLERVRPNASLTRDALLSTFGLPHNKRLIIIVANLRHDVKNIPMFLRAAEIVLRKHPDAGFVIAGEGGLMEDLRQMSRDLGIDDSVYFIGRCRQVPELLSLAEVGVLSSKAEGFSNSILEYMAAGKPVVATNVGGAAEAIVEGETGYLVESDDHTTMAARLRELLRNDVVARVMGAEGRRRVERQFSTQNQLQLTKDLYNTLF